VVGGALGPAWRPRPPRPPELAPLSIHDISASALEEDRGRGSLSSAVTMHHVSRRERERMRRLAMISTTCAVLAVVIAVLYFVTSRP
jgi:hypothetical protein